MPQLTMYRGDSAQFTIIVEQDGQAVDLVGSKLWFTAKHQYANKDNEAVMQLTTDPGGGIVLSTTVRGKALVTTSPLATRGFPDGDVALVYDVQMLDITGKITTVESGTLTVKPDVTRALS